MRKIILSPIYICYLHICLSNRGTPRRAEKLCHFHIFRPPLTSPVSREIHLRSNLNFKPVKFCCWFRVSSRPEQEAKGRGGKMEELKGRLGRVCMLSSDGGWQRRRRVCIEWINWLGRCKLEIWTFVKRIQDGGGIRFGELWKENLIEGIVGRLEFGHIFVKKRILELNCKSLDWELKDLGSGV